MTFKSIITDPNTKDIIERAEEKDCQNCGQVYFKDELFAFADLSHVCADCISTLLTFK